MSAARRAAITERFRLRRNRRRQSEPACRRARPIAIPKPGGRPQQILMKFISFLPVEEKGIMGTSGALAIPFSPCLSRKRQSWEHGHALAIPFPPACRGNGYHGIMACACDSLFPLPVEEKAIVGWLRFAFPPASRGKGFDRTQQSKATSSNDTPRARQVP